jgi:hypothetical protein
MSKLTGRRSLVSYLTTAVWIPYAVTIVTMFLLAFLPTTVATLEVRAIHRPEACIVCAIYSPAASAARDASLIAMGALDSPASWDVLWDDAWSIPRGARTCNSERQVKPAADPERGDDSSD